MFSKVFLYDVNNKIAHYKESVQFPEVGILSIERHGVYWAERRLCTPLSPPTKDSA